MVDSAGVRGGSWRAADGEVPVEEVGVGDGPGGDVGRGVADEFEGFAVDAFDCGAVGLGHDRREDGDVLRRSGWGWKVQKD